MPGSSLGSSRQARPRSSALALAEHRLGKTKAPDVVKSVCDLERNNKEDAYLRRNHRSESFGFRGRLGYNRIRILILSIEASLTARVTGP